MVGGIFPSRIAIMQKMTSSAPVVPIIWPVIDLVEETGILYARFPNTRLIALVSERSFNTVPVPCALM